MKIESYFNKYVSQLPPGGDVLFFSNICQELVVADTDLQKGWGGKGHFKMSGK